MKGLRAVISIISIGSLCSALAWTELRPPLKPHRPGELILCLEGPTPSLPKMKSVSLEDLASLSQTQRSKDLDRRLVLLKLASNEEANQLAKELINHPSVQWISPNYVASGDPREEVASDLREFNDPLYKDQGVFSLGSGMPRINTKIIN